MNAHTNTFDSEPVVGQLVTGHSDGPGYHSTWSGIYEGVRPSEWDGQPYHYFRDGEINGTPQSHFGHPVDRDAFDVAAAAEVIYAEIVDDVEAEDTLYVTDRPDPDYDFMLRSFSELHDFTDANVYLIDALGDREVDDPLWNALADAVDALLKATPIMLMEAREDMNFEAEEN
jgi:hypothetical protein